MRTDGQANIQTWRRFNSLFRNFPSSLIYELINDFVLLANNERYMLAFFSKSQLREMRKSFHILKKVVTEYFFF